MRTKSLLSVLILSIVVFGAAGCGGDDDGGTIDARPGADSSSLPDAGPMVDAAGTADATPLPMIPATNLGKACNAMTPCANAAGGEVCVTLEMGATSGICSIPCTCPAGMDGCEGSCGPGNMFPGPGVGYCALTSGMDPNLHFCGVGCGEQNGGNTMCPMGATCKDLINMNGMGDLCAP